MNKPTMAPGVYIENQFEQAQEGLRTAVPLFLGYVALRSSQADPGSWPVVKRLTLATQFDEFFAPLFDIPCSYLSQAVAGFFANGGQLCYVAPMTYDPYKPADTLDTKLTTLAALQEIDLVCAPDIMTHLPAKDPGECNETVIEMQRMILAHCDRLGDRFAILDAVGGPIPAEYSELAEVPAAVREQLQLTLQAEIKATKARCEWTLTDDGKLFFIRNVDHTPHVYTSVTSEQMRIKQQKGQEAVIKQRQALYGINGALYFPWIRVRTAENPNGRYVPPCGHVAGIFARTDQRSGVHKAPANEVLEGVTDLQYTLDNSEQGPLNEQGINCLRAFPGRGIRLWGARTLSTAPDWTYVNVRRLFLTVGRWIERSMAGLVFEPNDPRLWARIRRELTAYLNGLYQQGALKGRSAEEAFYVKCDAETNSADERDAGRVVTEIGLAPAQPGEWIVVHIIHGAGGVTISGPVRPT